MGTKNDLEVSTRLLMLLLMLLVSIVSAPCQGTVRGGKLFAGDQQNISVRGLPHNYFAYNLNNLYLASPREQSLGGFSSYILVYFFLSDYYYPSSTELGVFPNSGNGADELIFRLQSREPWLDMNGNWLGGFYDPHLWYTGPGSRNDDGVPHAEVVWLDGKTARVSYEDGDGGGDHSYNDAAFEVSGVHPGVDLRVSDLTYTVENSALPQQEFLPIAANGKLRVQFRVENIGDAKMQFASKVALYCSPDSTITNEDMMLATVDVPAGIEPHGSTQIVLEHIDMSEVLLNRQAWGMHYIGTICDPDLEIAESRRDNNSNWSEMRRQTVLEKGLLWEDGLIGEDTIGFYVYDPMAFGGFAQPNRVFPKIEFDSFEEAESVMMRAGFRSVALVEGPHTLRLRSSAAAFSHYFGKMMAGQYWTVHGHVLPRGGKYAIYTQAATANYPFGATLIHGEPDPYQMSISWVRYARKWHTAY